MMPINKILDPEASKSMAHVMTELLSSSTDDVTVIKTLAEMISGIAIGSVVKRGVNIEIWPAHFNLLGDLVKEKIFETLQEFVQEARNRIPECHCSKCSSKH